MFNLLRIQESKTGFTVVVICDFDTWQFIDDKSLSVSAYHNWTYSFFITLVQMIKIIGFTYIQNQKSDKQNIFAKISWKI